MALLYDANNIVIGHAVGWYAPWTPDHTLVSAFSHAAALWAQWPAPWVAAGATEEGYRVNVSQEATAHRIEEQSTPIAETIDSKGVTAEAALVEDTMETLKLAWAGSDIVTVAAGAGTPGTETMTLSDDIEYYVFGMEWRNFRGYARRLLVPKVSIRGSDAVSFRRAAAKRQYGIAVTSVCAPTEIVLTDITAPAA